MMSILRLIRGANLLIAAAGVFAGGWIALGAVAVPKALLFAALSGMAIGAVGNTWNDIRDVAADRVNRPRSRPLPSGAVARGTADLIVFWSTVLGLAFAGLVSGRQVLAAAVALGVMFLYSPVLKPRPVLGNLAVAALSGTATTCCTRAAGRLVIRRRRIPSPRTTSRTPVLRATVSGVRPKRTGRLLTRTPAGSIGQLG